MAETPQRHAPPTDGSVQFSTRGLPRPDHIRLWEDHNAESLIALRCRTFDVPHLDATALKVDVGDVGLARVVGTPHLVERTPDVIREHPSDSVACYVTLQGEAFFHHSEGTTTLRPGQLLVCDADRPFLRGFSHGLEELVLRIPRSVFHDVVSSRSLRGPVVHDLQAEGRHGQTLRHVVSNAVRVDHPRPPDRDLLLGLMKSVVEGRHEDRGSVHLAAAQTFIAEHLTDPQLSAAMVGAAIGLSPRHLSRVFAEADVSVPQYILGKRLELARAVLRSDTTLTIEQVAGKCGFGSATYFSQSFRRRFGVRASDVRRAAHAPAALD